MTKEELKVKLSNLLIAHTTAYQAYQRALSSGVASYTIGSRSLTNLTPEQIWAEIEKIEKEIKATENEIRGGAKRRTIGIIPRDW